MANGFNYKQRPFARPVADEDYVGNVPPKQADYSCAICGLVGMTAPCEHWKQFIAETEEPDLETWEHEGGAVR